jgi:hypothetical protein
MHKCQINPTKISPRKRVQTTDEISRDAFHIAEKQFLSEMEWRERASIHETGSGHPYQLQKEPIRVLMEPGRGGRRQPPSSATVVARANQATREGGVPSNWAADSTEAPPPEIAKP